MRQAFRYAVCSLAIALPMAGPATGQPSTTRREAPDSATVHAALSRVAPALVRIHVVTLDYQDGREPKREASGSGTIITPDGRVVGLLTMRSVQARPGMFLADGRYRGHGAAAGHPACRRRARDRAAGAGEMT